MVIDKNYEGLKRLENGAYILEYIRTDENLIIDLDDRLIVNRHIEADGFIEAGEHIKADGSIEADLGIVAMLHIKAKGYISSSLRIFAGVCTWRKLEEEEMTIECVELKNGEIAYGKLKIVENIKELTINEAENLLNEKLNYKVKIKIDK